MSTNLFDPISFPSESIRSAYYSGQFQRVLDFYEKILIADPHHAETHVCKGMCHLLCRNFPDGWREYEWRRKTMKLKYPSILFWKGESLKNKKIMVEYEQGFGDAIQFIRYLPLLKKRGATVILNGCPPTLQMLFLTMADVVLQDVNARPIPVHYQIPMMSLPYFFGTTLETVPSRVPYLQAPKKSGKKALDIISRYTGERIGIVWAGSKTHGHDKLRSIKTEQITELLNVSGITFFSLQKDKIPPKNIIDVGSCLDNFADTAAAIQELDLVISVDTSVAHLAGALGKPVWTLLPSVPDWRWMLNREDSPWYPTMRLFRQPTPGDWASVIKRVSEELKTLVGAR